MLKRVFCIFLIICLIFTPMLTVSAYEPSGVTITANAAMLVSLDTDEILYEKNADQQIYPASITKIMTALLILESDKYDPEAPIAMTESAIDGMSGTGSSVSLLKVGEEISQLDLVYMVLVSSYGDCALLAAEYYGGSEENFVNMMNSRAKELGLTKTNYVNSHGLHHNDHKTTARDTYILTKYALQNETFEKVFTSDRHPVQTSLSNTRTLSTTNFLIDNTTDYFYTHATGGKTGYTDEAGRCLVSTASYDVYNYMCLVFGCPPKEKKHFTESAELYRWAFKNFALKKVADTTNPVAEIGVDLSLDTDYVSLYVEKGFPSVLPKDADESTISIVPKPFNETVDAPIKKGQVLGTADIIYAEKVIGTVNLIANENIEKSGLLAVLRGLKNLLFSKYTKALGLLAVIAALIFIIAVIKLNSKKSKKRKIKYVPYKENKK